MKVLFIGGTGTISAAIVRRLAALGVTLDCTDAAVERLAEAGYDPVYGARPLRRAIQSQVEDPAAGLLLEGTLRTGDTVLADASEEGVTVTKKAG